MNEKSFELFSKEHEASVKFDYFICSIAGALCAYIGQTYTPHIFNSWYYFIMPIALLSLAICFLFALWLIKVSKDITKLNKEYVSYTEENEHIKNSLNDLNKTTGKPHETFLNIAGTLDKREDLIARFKQNFSRIEYKLKESSGKAGFADKLELLRNVSLAVGFILILVSKFIQPYFTN
jgi:hypothetical protein